MNIQNEIRDYIVENILYGEELKLKPDESFRDNSVLDSIGFLELITFVEEKYSIVVEDSEVVPKNFDSLVNISVFIEKKLKQKQLSYTNSDFIPVKS